MNSRLQAMLLVVGLMTIGGVTYQLATRQPPDVTMAELRDAGAASERVDRWVAVCPEKITQRTRNYLRTNGYGDFKVGSIHRIARVVWEYALTDGGRVLLNPGLIVTLDAGVDDGGVPTDPNNQTDDSFLFRLDDCYRVECNSTDGGLDQLRFLADGGFRYASDVDGSELPWCNSAVRRGRVTPPCVMPDCWLPDGGWDDNAVVDCQGIGPLGQPGTGLPRWRGCNTAPAAYAVGTQCVPVECTVVAGDSPPDVLR